MSLFEPVFDWQKSGKGLCFDGKGSRPCLILESVEGHEKQEYAVGSIGPVMGKACVVMKSKHDLGMCFSYDLCCPHAAFLALLCMLSDMA